MEIDDAIQELVDREEERVEKAERVRKESRNTLFSGENVHEESLLHDVEKVSVAGTSVAGVDGGMVRKEFRGTDIILTRGLAAVFEHGEEALKSSSYIPRRNPEPRVEFLLENLDRRQVDRYASLKRLEGEVKAAVPAADKADVVLLDGSVLPQSMDQPSQDSPLEEDYSDVVEKYNELYAKDAVVAGVVEDSRDSRVSRILEDNGFSTDALSTGRDSVVLGHVMEKGERTFIMDYADPGSHPVLGDMDDPGSFYTFHVKTVENDLPVKVDFYAEENPVETGERIASILFALSGSTSYGIPPVLLEADQRAKFSGQEVETVLKRIRSRAGHLPLLEELRRNRRPF